MTSPGSVRRLVVALTIGSFSFAALMGVLALLGGGTFGEAEGRVLLTTLVVGVTSIAVLCYLATAGTPYAVVGAVGGVTVLVPLVTSLLLIWAEDPFTDSDSIWEIFGTGGVLAASLAQASLMLALVGQRRRLRPLLIATLTLVAALAAIVSTIIFGLEPSDDVARLIGVVAILDVLGTVIAIALGVFGGPRPVSSDPAAATAITLPSALAAALDACARSTGRPRDEIVVEALAEHLSRTVGGSVQSGT